MNETDWEQRLQKIETSLAHLERLYEQLNEVVIDHAARLRRLQTQVQQAASTIENIEGDRIRSTNPKPPHHQ
jgi:uncharacterized coiled-coil protein SlyX